MHRIAATKTEAATQKNQNLFFTIGVLMPNLLPINCFCEKSGLKIEIKY